MTLRTEVVEQPDMLRLLRETWDEDVIELRRLAGPRPQGVLLVGRGTSDNAARFAQYVLGGEHGLPTALATPSLYSSRGEQPGFPRDWTIIAISQSGASPDLANVLGAACHRDNHRIAITNTPGSLLTSAADTVIPMRAGVETAVAATKTYTASLCAVLRLSDAWAETDPAGIDAAIAAIDQVLSREQEIARAAEDVAAMESCAVIGRGMHMATAFEWALKITETSCVAAVPFSSADFLHGPVAMVDRARPLLAVVDRDSHGYAIAGVVESLAGDRGTVSVVLTFADIVRGARSIRLPDAGSRLNPIVAAAAVQLFSLHLATARGQDPDNPRGLSKVTETT